MLPGLLFTCRREGGPWANLKLWVKVVGCNAVEGGKVSSQLLKEVVLSKLFSTAYLHISSGRAKAAVWGPLECERIPMNKNSECIKQAKEKEWSNF